MAESKLNDIIGTSLEKIKALADGEKVQISGLGSFEVKERAERTGRNPKTKEQITIPAAKYPAFSASKSLKESVNK